MLMSKKLCQSVGAGARLSSALVPSEKEEEGGRWVRNGRDSDALLTTATLCRCAGGVSSQGGGHRGRLSVGGTPVCHCPFLHPHSCSASYVRSLRFSL